MSAFSSTRACCPAAATHRLPSPNASSQSCNRKKLSDRPKAIEPLKGLQPQSAQNQLARTVQKRFWPPPTLYRLPKRQNFNVPQHGSLLQKIVPGSQPGEFAAAPGGFGDGEMGPFSIAGLALRVLVSESSAIRCLLSHELSQLILATELLTQVAGTKRGSVACSSNLSHGRISRRRFLGYCRVGARAVDTKATVDDRRIERRRQEFWSNRAGRQFVRVERQRSPVALAEARISRAAEGKEATIVRQDKELCLASLSPPLRYQIDR